MNGDKNITTPLDDETAGQIAHKRASDPDGTKPLVFDSTRDTIPANGGPIAPIPKPADPRPEFEWTVAHTIDGSWTEVAAAAYHQVSADGDWVEFKNRDGKPVVIVRSVFVLSITRGAEVKNA